MKKPPAIYIIDWVDSCGSQGWLQIGECKARVSECQTVGFLVDETKDAIALALNRVTIEGHAPFGEMITIPKFAITKKRVLK